MRGAVAVCAYPARVRLRLVFALAAAAALVAAGCGSTPQAEEETRAVTTDDLITDFGAQPGSLTLKRSGGTGGKYEQLGIGLDPPPEALRRYGIFSIYVVEPGADDARAALLTDKTTGEPLEPDERGIYWERDTLSGTWVANKRYGANVVLAWFSDRSQAATDARFERLDRILAGLERGALG